MGAEGRRRDAARVSPAIEEHTVSAASAAAAAANGDAATMSPSLGVAGAVDSLSGPSATAPTGEFPCRCTGMPAGSAGCLLSCGGCGPPAPGAGGGSGGPWAGPWLRSTSARFACTEPWNGLEERVEMQRPGREPTLMQSGGGWRESPGQQCGGHGSAGTLGGAPLAGRRRWVAGGTRMGQVQGRDRWQHNPGGVGKQQARR